MAYWTQLTHERLFPPHQIAAIVELLFNEGVAMEDSLVGTGLPVSALRDASQLTSIAQHQQVCTSALRLARDPTIALRAGASLHLSAHGLYGLLLMSCESARECFNLAVKYQWLAAPTRMFSWHDRASEGVRLRLDPAERALPPALEVFLVEQQLMQQLTQMRDALGASIQPTMACFAYPAPAHGEHYASHFDCPCRFDCEHSELQFSKDILARRPALANPLTAATLRSACDGLLAQLEASLGFAGKVYQTLRHLSDPGASMTTVAAALKMTDRTLRRRLADEGTCFSDIAYRVKYCVAAQHLKNSDASIEQIASIAGFSDPANFRRAFLRWTRMTPAQFRRQHIA